MTASGTSTREGSASGVRVIRDLDELRACLDSARAAQRRVALVPTMGNLHAGHIALVHRARELGEVVIATIFVNPFQFGANEDFDSYPRTFDQDLARLAQARCDLVFAPQGATVYPHGPDVITRVEVPRLGDILCGESRPGFFRGVATVVNILFNMVQPDVAVFGNKDYQQLLVIRRMVDDLRLRVRIEGVATVREADGLAMSSRNAYLSAAQRERAPAIHRTLLEARAALRSGERDHARVQARGHEALVRAGLRPDYFQVRRANDLEPAIDPGDALVVLAAAHLGKARLIDNVTV
jgi:pantoate--beta-alanine ligase